MYRRRGENAQDAPGGIPALGILVIILLLFATTCYTIVPGTKIGVLFRLGKVDTSAQEPGFHLKRSVLDKFVMMPRETMSTHVIESTASSDMQEIQTQLSVQYRIIPSMAPEVYINYQKNWENTQIKPIIFEEMKATTADWTAEQLIQERSQVMLQLRDQLTHRFAPLGFQVVSVNIEDLQFSQEYWDAIEAKAVATQNALAEKNKVEVTRYKEEQTTLKKQQEMFRLIVEANATAQEDVILSTGKATAMIIEAEAHAVATMLEFNATAKGISQLKTQLTDGYIAYLLANGWDGKLPLIQGEGELFLDVRALLEGDN